MSAMQGSAGSDAGVKAFILPAVRGLHVDEEQGKWKAALSRRGSANGGQGNYPEYLRFLLVEQSVSEWDWA